MRNWIINDTASFIKPVYCYSIPSIQNCSDQRQVDYQGDTVMFLLLKTKR